MKLNNRIELISVLIVLFTINIISSCSCARSKLDLDYVVVFEKCWRFESKLPIDKTEIEKLKYFLENKRAKEDDAEESFGGIPSGFYDGLIDLVTNKNEKIEESDFLEKTNKGKVVGQGVKKWFKRIGFRIIDSQNSCFEEFGTYIAFWDGRLWWIFIKDNTDTDIYSKIVVTLPLGTTTEGIIYNQSLK